MALSLAILMLFLALGSGTAVWAAEATGSSTLEQHLEKGYVTQQDLRSAPHNVETEDAAIPAKYFEFVCVNHHADGSACTDLQTASISSIKGGRLRNNVPLTLKNNSDVRHTFSRAHIGNTAVTSWERLRSLKMTALSRSISTIPPIKTLQTRRHMRF